MPKSDDLAVLGMIFITFAPLLVIHLIARILAGTSDSPQRALVLAAVLKKALGTPTDKSAKC